mmetsp:Transcript_6652/g.11193  ORF Transcript_6652/g.11193 Transcript_6652/m.11193 type:complete len:177 (+) Transcript_6652:441-971(+)
MLRECAEDMRAKFEDADDHNQTNSKQFLQMMQYYMLRTKQFMVLKNLDKCRSYLYKMELKLKEKYPLNKPELPVEARFDGFILRTELYLLQSKSYVLFREVLPAHYSLKNWMEKLENFQQEFDQHLKDKQSENATAKTPAKRVQRRPSIIHRKMGVLMNQMEIQVYERQANPTKQY